MTDLMTYPYTTSHISLKISNVFRHSHNNMVRSAEERFAMERMATRGFGSKKIPLVSTTLAAEAALGWRRGVAQYWATTSCGGWCASCFPYMFRLTSLGVSSVSLVRGSMAVMRSAFVPQRSSTPGFLLTHTAQSPVFANVCRRLASAASIRTWRRSTGQQSR